MASFDDLGQVLRDDAAANAPRASMIDVDAVARAARARRLPRQWAVGTLSLVALLGLGGIAVAAVTPPLMIAASESADLEMGGAESDSAPLAEGADVESAPRGDRVASLLACGGSVPFVDANELGLELEVSAHSSAPAMGEQIIASVVLTNEGTTSVAVVSGPEAVGALVADGVIVGTGSVRASIAHEFELAPGESRELPVRLETTHCPDLGGPALEPGDYSAAVMLEVTDAATGASVVLVAPPVAVRLD